MTVLWTCQYPGARDCAQIENALSEPERIPNQHRILQICSNVDLQKHRQSLKTKTIQTAPMRKWTLNFGRRVSRHDFHFAGLRLYAHDVCDVGAEIRWLKRLVG